MKESEQKKLIHKKDWTYLIILDGCRYDLFERNYRSYFSGELQKVESVAEDTSTWVKEVFGGKKFSDIVYVSANPHISSDIKIEGFLGGKHFYKVIDVWDWGWDNNWGTVPPRRVSEATKEVKSIYPDKKFLIHFIQPHGPFPQLKSLKVRESPLGKIRSLVDGWGIEHMGRRKFRKVKESIWKSLFWPFWKRFEGQQQATLGTEDIAKKYGAETLRALYEENLKLALEEVKDLVNHLSGKIVISADHGEALGGEEGFGHRKMAVPWLEMEGEANLGLQGLEQDRISSRIRNLKQKDEI